MENTPLLIAPDFNERENPLYRLFHRKDGKGRSLLSEPQFAAGEQLRADYEAAQFEARITAAWTGERAARPSYASISDNSISRLSDSALDARKRVHAAFDAVGPELAGILYFVCCLAGGLEHAERLLAMPARSGKAVLSLALTRLARHYRFLQPPASEARLRSIGHWALGDYRPAIMPPVPPERQT
jgi:Domain of unknown function (DUF6456)